MEKEFIPYEQALALKELGFDSKEFLSLIFVDDENKFYSPSGWIPNNAMWTPTFSQAFRWFRDKHKVSGEITSSFYSEGEENEWEFNIYQLDKEDEEYNTLPIFKSYEEAELECLKKLIEICKNKKN